MSFDPVTAGIDLFNNILAKFIPDADTRAKAAQALLDAQREEAHDQAEINKVEAASASLFVGGWRPFIGWVCGFAFVYQFIGEPLLAWLSAVKGIPAPPPLDVSTLSTVLMGMLGLGSMRSFEKYHGVTK